MRISDWSSDVCSSDLQSGEDQRQAGWARVMFGDGAIDFAKVAITVPVDLRLLAAAASLHLHRVAAFAGAAITLGKPTLTLLGEVAAQGVGDRKSTRLNSSH